MELINVTNFPAEYSTATDKTGREWLVVVAKATYGFPSVLDHQPLLLTEQVPLFTVDQFLGEVGSSSLSHEMDFALRKPYCDVLLNGSCYSPQGKPAKKVTVRLNVGQVSKSFNVIGNRTWEPRLLYGVQPGEPEPFSVMPISYERAFGGIDEPTSDPLTHRWYPMNPVGLGFRPHTPVKKLYTQRLPNTEEIGKPIASVDGTYKPMAFGPVGRSWQQRIAWAGTYDDTWRREQYPFLPNDFDDRYFQSAPQDQQTPHLVGGERVIMENLVPSGRIEFTLPKMSEPLTIRYKNGDTRRTTGVVDTLVLEPDFERFTLILRTSFQLRRNLHELRSVEFGRVFPQALPRDGERQIPTAKPHYKSLSEFVAARAAERSVCGGDR